MADTCREGEPRSAEAAALTSVLELESALEQKTELLHELDHRAKNNLQLISSLIQLQSRRLDDPATTAAMKATLGRVNAIGMAHRSLLQLDTGAASDVTALVSRMATDLVEAERREDIALRLDLAALTAPAASGAPLALIVNELVTNALAHAFPYRGGTISIAIRPEDDACVIEVSDDGVGLSRAGPVSGFGLDLVSLLAKQLSATVRKTDNGRGLSVTVALPASQHRDDTER